MSATPPADRLKAARDQDEGTDSGMTDSENEEQRNAAQNTLRDLETQQEHVPIGGAAAKRPTSNTRADLQEQEKGTAADMTDSQTELQHQATQNVLRDLEMQAHHRDGEGKATTSPEEKPASPSKKLLSSAFAARHSIWQRFAVYANLVTFSILGAATRIGLTRLATYPGQSVFPTAVSQAVGCAVMGLVVRNKALLEAIDISVFIGLGTGYCGSVTTFSTWMVETFEAFGNVHNFPHGGVRNVCDGLTQLFITFAVAVAGLRFGIHTSTFLRMIRVLPPSSDKPRFHPKPALTYALSYVACVCSFLAVLFMSIFIPSWRHVTLALVFAPAGTFARYILSKSNVLDLQFPIGTLSANLIATAILSACIAIQKQTIAPLSCGVLQGLVDGFCGCMSTVSTFAVELRGLRRFAAYRYALVSVLGGIALCVLIYGSVWWSVGLPAMCTYQT